MDLFITKLSLGPDIEEGEAPGIPGGGVGIGVPDEGADFMQIFCVIVWALLAGHRFCFFL